MYRCEPAGRLVAAVLFAMFLGRSEIALGSRQVPVAWVISTGTTFRIGASMVDKVQWHGTRSRIVDSAFPEAPTADDTIAGALVA